MDWKRSSRESRNVTNLTILFQLKRPCEALKFTAKKKESESYDINSDDEVEEEVEEK